jgi:S-adenosylmethionine uptake transporter
MMDGAMKTLALEVGVFSALLWRAAFLIPLGAILYLRSKPQKPSTEAMKLHTLRGLLSLVMALLFFGVSLKFRSRKQPASHLLHP